MAAPTVADLSSVQTIKARLLALLELAAKVKPDTSVEPPLPVTSVLRTALSLGDGLNDTYDQSYRFAAIETAVRDIFYARVVSTDIEDPRFVEIWNLFDLLMICGDHGVCTPELVCWLIEELLDSQTTIGCRTVFDYLESRRERLAAKDFHKKNLVFLRCCNELLRRLSRAEDSIFCGRVFFFLFQTFPLGDKSSVNLRGEFHTENITQFESEAANGNGIEGDSMDIDTPKSGSAPATPRPGSKDSRPGSVKPNKRSIEEDVLETNALYPIFWRLQQDFCEPVRLFLPENFGAFKKGLAQTIRKFKATPTVPQSHAVEQGRRGANFKDDDDDNKTMEDTNDAFADNYNPKYLTSRKLFDLELSDLAFQRHIMVQALILIEFLLSLTEKAKKKLTEVDAANKSMLYTFTLSDEDATWASTTRASIVTYLQSVGDGRFFCRMVETVLTRDKNWVRWKVEGCPSIIRDPVSTEQELEARKGTREATRPRRLPARPTGGMDFSFLKPGYNGGLEVLKKPARFTHITADELIRGIQTDELDLDFAVGDEEEQLRARIDNKKWRIARQVRASNLALLDRMEPGQSWEALLKPQTSEVDLKSGEKHHEEEKEEQEEDGDEEEGEDVRNGNDSTDDKMGDTDTNHDADTSPVHNEDDGQAIPPAEQGDTARAQVTAGDDDEMKDVGDGDS